ncbi:MAG TPA: OmpA family protein [Bacteroidia bacterium]|nr:OmpA family protein [Bacteroidia bacterium]
MIQPFFKFVFLIILIGRHDAFSQNLVVNATFEAKHLRKGFGEITKAHAWGNANGGSVDLFTGKNNRFKNAVNGIPENYMGTQSSTEGLNYTGIVAYYDDGDNDYFIQEVNGRRFPFKKSNGYKQYTEYLEGEFREPMVAGTVYRLSFKVSLADQSGRAVSCLGALITDKKVKEKSNTFLKQVPQFVSHRVISDTASWVVLSGAYIALGGEKYITIGCFKDEGFMVEKVVGKMQQDSRKAYYYVSGISVTPYAEEKSNLEAIVRGVDYIELMDLQFASGNSEIMPGFYRELDEVANWMVKYPDYRFFVAGYADQLGRTAVNDSLSQQRAINVKNYLANKGVNAANILTEGFGSENPLENKLKSRKNRRVEIYLYSTGKVTQ